MSAEDPALTTSTSVPPYYIDRPDRQTVPLIFASPHSGRDYPPAFVAKAQLDPLSLRRSEDAFVDNLFAAAPSKGASLIRATFPRAFIDANREPFELDQNMFSDHLPDYVNIKSGRVAAGLGTIPRIVSGGQEIYTEKLTFSEAIARIEAYYKPYHSALNELIDEVRKQFDYCVLVDCHSMPCFNHSSPTTKLFCSLKLSTTAFCSESLVVVIFDFNSTNFLFCSFNCTKRLTLP